MAYCSLLFLVGSVQTDGVLLLAVVADQSAVRVQLAAKNHLGCRVLNQPLDGTAQRTGSVAGTVALGAQFPPCGRCAVQPQV